jgi:hypothetical protein
MAKAGRPKKQFTKDQIALVKRVVSEFGLTGAEQVLNESGIIASVPTLRKLVRSGKGGRPPLRLKRGRPRKVVEEVVVKEVVVKEVVVEAA